MYRGLAQERDPRAALSQNGRGWMGRSCDPGNVALNFSPRHVHEMPFLVGTIPAQMLANNLGGRNLVNPIKQIRWRVRTRDFHPRDRYGRSARYT